MTPCCRCVPAPKERSWHVFSTRKDSHSLSLVSADSPAFAQEAQQALTRVTGWSEVSSVISFTDNPRQISLDRHAAYANVLLMADPDSAPKLLPELERRLQAVPDLQAHIGGGPVFFADIQLYLYLR